MAGRRLAIAAAAAMIPIIFLSVLLDAAYALSVLAAVRLEIALEDLHGDAVKTTSSGMPVVITVTTYNEKDMDLPYVTYIEVRDSDGVTVYLSWQGNALSPFGGNRMQAYWLAGEPGSYTMRTFALGSLETPEALSDVKSAELTVR